jgi:hypothetical protein
MREIAQHCTDDERAVSGTVSEPVSLLPEQFARAASALGCAANRTMSRIDIAGTS